MPTLAIVAEGKVEIRFPVSSLVCLLRSGQEPCCRVIASFARNASRPKENTRRQQEIKAQKLISYSMLQNFLSFVLGLF